jgi:hypothetical protein
MSTMSQIAKLNRFSSLAIDSDDESSNDSSVLCSIMPKKLLNSVPKPKSITSTKVKDKYNKFQQTTNSVVFQNTSKICERFFDCCFCNQNHSMRKCYNFQHIKDGITKSNYFDKTKLKPSDEAGFCAAGIIPYYVDSDNNKWVLMLIENRSTEYNKTGDHIPGLNFVAGGRECIKNTSTNNIVPETSYQTALGEFEEELSEILTENSFKLIKQEIVGSSPTFVYWSGVIKMALYGVEIKTDLRTSLVLDPNSKSKQTEAQNFEWISLSEYDKYVYKSNSGPITEAGLKFHKFTKNLVDQIVRNLN